MIHMFELFYSCSSTFKIINIWNLEGKKGFQRISKIQYFYSLSLSTFTLSFISFKSVLKQFETNQAKLIIENECIVIVSGGASSERFALAETGCRPGCQKW